MKISDSRHKKLQLLIQIPGAKVKHPAGLCLSAYFLCAYLNFDTGFPAQLLYELRKCLHGHLLLGNIWKFACSLVMVAVLPDEKLRCLDVK